MDAKKILKNKSFCVLPWTGFELEPNGTIKNCIISKTILGDTQNKDILSILQDNPNKKIKEQMLYDKKPKNCSGCHVQERGRKNLSSISSRLYYMKELAPSIDMTLYDNIENFSLHHVDLRWTNHCNQACVYCGPEYSSKWAQEIGREIKSSMQARHNIKNFVFENVSKLKNVYLAGGEPLLMNENRELLKLLYEKNPNVNLRINTNLSSTDTGVFDLICKFKNVHWTVSVEATGAQYEYIRYHGVWKKFIENLQIIKNLDHKISFNMLYFLLNYKSIFNTIDFFKNIGFHENSFIIGPLLEPKYLNILNLPEKLKDKIKFCLEEKILKSEHYLKNSYENIYNYINETKGKYEIQNFFTEIQKLDTRRKQSAEKIFPELFEDLKQNV
jgi:MoaA/NifB/PqqE/SkfB family radical SAM enzyme